MTQEERDRLPTIDNETPVEKAAPQKALPLTTIGTFNGVPMVGAIILDPQNGVVLCCGDNPDDRGKMIVVLAGILNSLAKGIFLKDVVPTKSIIEAPYVRLRP